jgi:hypothetical protein
MSDGTPAPNDAVPPTAARSMKKRNYMGYFYIFRKNMNRPASTRISAKISA